MDGRRALVIDDEVHFRYFLRVLLEKAGFAVKMARNGIEALDVLRSWRPDVITLDVMMPEQSGLTFYGAVCRDEDWKRIPVVMLSAVPISVMGTGFTILADADFLPDFTGLSACSTMLFHAPQAGQRPAHLGVSLPHSVQ